MLFDFLYSFILLIFFLWNCQTIFAVTIVNYSNFFKKQSLNKKWQFKFDLNVIVVGNWELFLSLSLMIHANAGILPNSGIQHYINKQWTNLCLKIDVILIFDTLIISNIIYNIQSRMLYSNGSMYWIKKYKNACFWRFMVVGKHYFYLNCTLYQT